MLKFQKLNDNAIKPIRSTPNSAGLDLFTSEKINIPPCQQKVIGTGIVIQIPDGYYGRIAPCSGLTIQHHIDIRAGVIDSDYRGEIKIVVHNSGDEIFRKKNGDKIAQLIIEKIAILKPVEVDNLSPTLRGTRGLGSTSIESNFILFEGLDGCGKTTIIHELAKVFRKKNMSVFETQEPTKNIEKKISFNFISDRVEHSKEIKKQINDNKIVLCNRYDISTYLYQKDNLFDIYVWHNAKKLIYPKYTFILDIPPEIAISRINSREKTVDTFENIEYLTEVYNKIDSVIKFINQIFPERQIIKIDATKKINQIIKEILPFLF